MSVVSGLCSFTGHPQPLNFPRKSPPNAGHGGVSSKKFSLLFFLEAGKVSSTFLKVTGHSAFTGFSRRLPRPNFSSAGCGLPPHSDRKIAKLTFRSFASTVEDAPRPRRLVGRRRSAKEQGSRTRNDGGK